jgi:hypothetical protein
MSAPQVRMIVLSTDDLEESGNGLVFYKSLPR